MSTPTLAESGTMFTPSPPANVPTFIVGLPIPLRSRDMLRPDAPPLLLRREHEHYARRSGQLLRDAPSGEQHRREAGLHVGGAAAVQPVAVRLSAKGILGPFTGAERNDVEMSGQAERRLRIAPTRPRDHARARVLVLVVGDLEAPFLQHRTDDMRAVALAARRIDRVEAQQP